MDLCLRNLQQLSALAEKCLVRHWQTFSWALYSYFRSNSSRKIPFFSTNQVNSYHRYRPLPWLSMIRYCLDQRLFILLNFIWHFFAIFFSFLTLVVILSSSLQAHPPKILLLKGQSTCFSGHSDQFSWQAHLHQSFSPICSNPVTKSHRLAYSYLWNLGHFDANPAASPLCPLSPIHLQMPIVW